MYSPWRIVEDCGAAFAMGCIGGGVFSFWKGYRNSPVVCTGFLSLLINTGRRGGGVTQAGVGYFIIKYFHL